ncbi:MAG: hypothetical protein ACW97Z_13645 [Candidatus Hodarchaeales archaeon]|jgi:hypothetical protein
MSFPQNLSHRWGLEARLFANIGTLDLISRTYDRGEIDSSTYHKQHRTLLTSIIETRAQLEQYKFDVDRFIEEEGIAQLFPSGLSKLKMTEGADDNTYSQIDYSNIKKLPTIAAEFVANAIELLDLLHLESIATVDRVLPYLDEIHDILVRAPMYGDNHWVTQDIKQWINWMDKQKPGQLLKSDEIKKLELQGSRWLSDFRRELKNL